MKPRNATRMTLLQKLQDQHDETSWGEFISIYKPYIFVVLRNMGLSHHDCEDLSQNVVLRAWEKLPGFDYDPGKGKFRGWLTAIAKNMARNYLSQNSNRLKLLKKHVEDKSDINDHINRVILPELEKRAESEWRVFIANRAWDNVKDRLSDNLKEAFLRCSKGESIAEIAEAIGIAENSVYKYKNRVQNIICKEIVRLENEIG
jgi:RNA polymerase sigma factor (sigma-70 family)